MVASIYIIFQISLIGLFLLFLVQALNRFNKLFIKLEDLKSYSCYSSDLKILDHQLSLLKQDYDYKIKEVQLNIDDVLIKVEKNKDLLEEIENYLDKESTISFKKRNKNYEQR